MAPSQTQPVTNDPLDRLTWKQVSLVCGAAMAMLYCAFDPVGAWPLAWIAPAVWACGVIFARSTKTAILIGWATWLVFWLASIWWLILPTGVGYGLGAGYQALSAPILAWAIRKTARAGFPMWVALPLLWCAMEMFRSAGPLPFEWYFLAHSQWQQLSLIQIAELTGPLGVSFVVAMGAGLIVDWARVKFAHWPKFPVIVSFVVVATILAVVWTWGVIRYSMVRCIENAPRPQVHIGVVQEVFPLSLDERPASPDEYLDRHIVLTLDLLKDTPDIVLWPETMLPGGLNREAALFNPYEASETSLRCFARRLGRTSGMATAEIRAAVAMRVGKLTMAEYRAAAARVLVHRYLKDDQFAALSGDAIATLYRYAWGETLPAAVVARRDAPSRILEKRVIVETYMRGKFAELRTLKTDQARRSMRLDIHRVYGCLRGRAALVQILAVAMDCPILSGGSTWKPNPTPLDDTDLWVYHNGAVEFTRGGDWGWSYAKRQLVPFSEYVPGKYSATTLWRWMREAVPVVMVQIEPGRSDKPYLLPAKPQQSRSSSVWREGDYSHHGPVELHTPICFEGTFARRCREMLLAGKPGLQKILINLSNDGWFVYTARPGSPQQTPEHRLHFAHSVFRAIETRTPVVRVVNTGISGWIDATGRVRKTMEKLGPSGRNDTIAPQSEVYRIAPGGQETTLYLRCGEWFAVAVVGGCGLLAGITFLRSRNKRNQL